MANLTFLTNTLTGLTYNWSTTANWDAGNVPINNDSVTLSTGNGNAITYTSLDDIALLTLNDLTTNNGATLDIGSTDSLTIQANLFSNAGTINVFGTLAVQNITSASNSGTIDANGGSVTLQNINDQTGSFIIEAGGNMTISYSGNVNGAPTFFLRDGLLLFQSNTPGQADVDFTGSAAGHLAFNTTTNGNATNNSLVNMGLGDSIEFNDANITNVSYNNSSNTLTLTTDQTPGNNTYNIHIASFDSSVGSAPNFILATDPVTNKNEAEVICFLRGTRIRTPDGSKPVELLLIGDKVLTADGQTRAVRWLWRQTVVTAFADELRAYPIHIRAGALDENVPERDLFLSPDHAILVDECLVQAAALVNNATITRVLKPEPRFVYYHIELEDHALVLAEGVASETFVDNITRRRFDNYADYEAMYGAGEVPIAEMDVPRAKSARQLPRQIRERLAARSEALSVRTREVA
jgi:Hint domain